MIYLDTSAIIRLIVAGEPWGEELRTFLRQQSGDLAATSVVGHVEVFRTLIRLGAPAPDHATAGAMLADFRLVALTDDVRRAAAGLPGKGLRSLDAIHVASAQQLGAVLTILVSYDHRMIDAALGLGLPVASPGMTR